MNFVAPHEDIARSLASRLAPGTVLVADQPLAKRTTLRVGGRADLYVEPGSEADLALVLRYAAEVALPVTILGRGSNLLIRDGGIRGFVVCLASPAFSRIVVEGDRLRCGAGARLKAVSVEARRAGIAGLEFLEGIPGSVGGALRMNAGAMGASTFQVVESMRFMDRAGSVVERPAAEIPVVYRSCPLLKSAIALEAVLRGRPDVPEAVGARMSAYSEKRWETQPPQPSAGCIFKNPASIPAGRLIDELGLKGTRVGDAMVSDIHGNFIINAGNARAAEVLELIGIIRERARAARGIELETEVEILGED
jgi:UDP-N-acetylenolpyruvoylglucosamine reductase